MSKQLGRILEVMFFYVFLCWIIPAIVFHPQSFEAIKITHTALGVALSIASVIFMVKSK